MANIATPFFKSNISSDFNLPLPAPWLVIIFCFINFWKWDVYRFFLEGYLFSLFSVSITWSCFMFNVSVNKTSCHILNVGFPYSALMSGFYLYKIATGGNHIPSKAQWTCQLKFQVYNSNYTMHAVTDQSACDYHAFKVGKTNGLWFRCGRKDLNA